jgi:hypothetical protein
MNELSQVAPAFVEMAHRIVWCSAATVDVKGRPRSRILHPFWQWDGARLVGWIGTSPTPLIGSGPLGEITLREEPLWNILRLFERH